MKTLTQYVLRLGDNGLVLSQRLGAWCGHAPELEIDLALANIGLDLLGQARNFLTYAAELEGEGDEDTLAFQRDAAGGTAKRQLRRHHCPSVLYRRLARGALYPSDPEP